MRFVLLCHPGFMGSESMPRFARMIEQALLDRGHSVVVWQPKARVHAWVQRHAAWRRWAKWAGYVDQYLIFPREIRAAALREPDETLFVFCDQALGPWVPCLARRPHVVHAHDLLALRSALGLIPENPTGWTGRVYQRYIRRGFQKAQHFISVSGRTRDDLHRHGGVQPVISEVVYNGLNHPYTRVPEGRARAILEAAGLPAVPRGLLLHVGGGTWYKNTEGVVRLYAAYAAQVESPLPLWMVSPPPSPEVQRALADVPAAGRVHFMQKLGTDVVEAAYSLADAMLFPSLAEGFGWPIIEAQACGAMVVTTDDAPMNEIAGPHNVLLPLRKPDEPMSAWAEAGAARLLAALCEVSGEGDDVHVRREERVKARMAWAARFSQEQAIEGYLAVYDQVMRRCVGRGLPRP